MYKVITQGAGTTKPSATSKVTVHYEGTLVTGEVFDSSYKRGETISFGLNQVIKCWTEGVQLMTIGSKYELYCPQELAYGSSSMSIIKPYSTLVFTVELFKIDGKDEL
jgi:FKBP-type peptidyl-prolyl cis-trans isomerase